MKKDLINDFNSFEKELGLFERSYEGIKIWPLIREKVYTKILKEHQSYYNKAPTDKNIELLILIFKIIAIIKNTFKFWFKKIKKTDVIFVGHSRRKKNNNKYIDIYTDPVAELLKVTSQTIEPLYQLGHYKPPVTKEIIYLDSIEFWPRFWSLIFRKKMSDGDYEFWSNVEKKINRKFNSPEIDLVYLIELEFTRFQLTKFRLKALLKKIDPSLIIEVESYHRINIFLNIIAKDLGITTAELQHGRIGSKHIAYRFPNQVEVKSFPDYLFIWGDYWRRNIRVPIDDSKIVTTGFEYFNKKKSTKKSISQRKKILFISQGTIGPKLADSALKLLDTNEFSDYEILYKLHPSEFHLAKKRYQKLYQSPEIEVLDSKSNKDLYHLIIDSSIIIGVYSTVLLEAIGLGKKVFVLKIKGWEMFEDFIDDDLNIKLLENIESLKNTSINLFNTHNPNSSQLLFSPTDYSIIEKII